MPKIRFLQDRTTVEAEPQHFSAGQVYELNEASCERWVRRGVAEHVTTEKRTSKATAKPVTAEAAAEGQTPSSQLDLAAPQSTPEA